MKPARQNQANDLPLFAAMEDVLPPDPPAPSPVSAAPVRTYADMQMYVKGARVAGVCIADLYYGTVADRGRLAVAAGTAVEIEIAPVDDPTLWVYVDGRIQWTFNPGQREKFDRHFQFNRGLAQRA